MGPKSGSQIRVPNQGPKWGSQNTPQIRVPNRVPNRGPYPPRPPHITSQIRVLYHPLNPLHTQKRLVMVLLHVLFLCYKNFQKEKEKQSYYLHLAMQVKILSVRGFKSGSQIGVPNGGVPNRGPNQGPNWGFQIRVPNRGPKSGSQIRVPNRGLKSGS
jgi:hypothetical protein